MVKFLKPQKLKNEKMKIILLKIVKNKIMILCKKQMILKKEKYK